MGRETLPSPHDRVRAGVERDGRVTFVDLRAPLLAADARARVFPDRFTRNHNGAAVDMVN